MMTFSHPTTILIARPTQAGKTFFFKQILEHQLILPSTSRVIFVVDENGPNLSDVKLLDRTIEDIQGMKNLIDILPTIEADEVNLVVLDDQMSEAGKLEETSNLFIKESHHRNNTVLLRVQNVFDKQNVTSTISLNSPYMVLFKNAPDDGQMRSIAQQVFPIKVKVFIDSFREATKKDYGSLHALTFNPVRVSARV